MKIHKAINILLIVVLLLTGFSANPSSIRAQGAEEQAIDQMKTFSVLASLGAESLGLTQIEGDLGIAAEGAEVLGDWQVGGEKHFGPDSLANSALEEARSLDGELAQKACDTTVVGDPNGPTAVVLTPGVTCLEGDSVILKEVTFDVGEVESGEFVIRTTGEVIFADQSRANLSEPEQEGSVIWQIGGGLIGGERSELAGTFLVKDNIELGARTRVSGQLISLEGTVLMNEGLVQFEYEEPQIAEPVGPIEVMEPEPTLEPTLEPTVEPTLEPTLEPTVEPTPEPTLEPTVEPTSEPTEEPIPEPTVDPTQIPTDILPTPKMEYLVDVIVPTSGELVPDHYNVVYKPDYQINSNKEPIESALKARGGSIVYYYGFRDNSYLAILPPEALAYIRSDPEVEFVEAVALQEGQELNVEIVNPYFSVEHLTLEDGSTISIANINGPSEPPLGRASTESVLPSAGVIASFPSYDWVFGCSAVSAAMIAGYYDRYGYPNMYTGPTAGGIMPLTDTSWPAWSDGYRSWPSNPLVASRNGLDGRTTRGSIDDYWVKVDSTANDPYITGGWSQHAYGTAIGDYMKTSQSSSGNVDGSTRFYFDPSGSKKYCASLPSDDGTRGRKEFYEARGYSLSTCYYQVTDNYASGGFTLQNFKNEIDAGRPVIINVTGHTMVGYGYNGSTIYIRDTWDSNPANVYSMPWGGSYEGMEMWGVSIVNLVPAVTNTPTPLKPSGYIYQKYPTFTWTKVPGATSYSVQVYVSSGLVINKIVYASACGTTQCSAVIGPLPYVSQYFWRVSAYTGGWGPSSADKYFTRLAAVPTLVAPSGVVSIPNPQFKWKPIPGATNYNIELYRNSALYTHMTLSNDACNSTICQVRLSNNLSTGSYFWRVKVFVEGCWDTFSPFMYFTRSGPPPIVTAPVGNIYFKSPTFTWNKVPGATSYNIQVYTGSSLVFNEIVSSSVCGTSQCSKVIGPLPYVTHYSWRASAYEGSWGAWSNYKLFTRLAPIPTLVTPSGLVSIPNPQFKWKAIPGATNYNIELYRNSRLYTHMTLTNSACSSTICQVRLSNSLPDGNYVWRVKVFIEGSWNSFSSYMYFTKSPVVGFQNPGFEQEHLGWTEYSSNGWEVIWPQTIAHTGSWVAWLGGEYNETTMLGQTINISSATPYLHFWYFSASADICGYDFFSVRVNDQIVLSTNLCKTTNTNGWMKKVVNLSKYVGPNKTVKFWVITDGSLNSNVYIDDVSMSASAAQSETERSSMEVISEASQLIKSRTK